MDWQAVAESGRTFAFTKASEGTDYVNPTFEVNWSEIKRVGLVRGAYHFARPVQGSSWDEATHFLDTIERAGGWENGDLLALDLESGTGDLRNWTLGFLQSVALETGITPLLYSGNWFLGPHGCTSDPELGKYPLWLAAYSIAVPSPPPGWGGLFLWQHTDAASVPGVAGRCDEDIVIALP